MNYNREQLYNLVWTKPLNTAAADCGITVPVLRQICLNYEVPLPWGGYKSDKERIELPVGNDFELSAAIIEAVTSLHFSGENKATFIVPRKLTNPDPLILRVQNTIMKDYQFHDMPHMLRSGFGELAIRSSKSNIHRAILIMDTLVKAWRHRGYRIVNQNKETAIYLREVSIRVGLRETTTIESSKERFGSRIHIATGKLAFKVDGWLDREWKDVIVPLENHVHEILDHMEVAARDLEKSWPKIRYVIGSGPNSDKPRLCLLKRMLKKPPLSSRWLWKRSTGSNYKSLTNISMRSGKQSLVALLLNNGLIGRIIAGAYLILLKNERRIYRKQLGKNKCIRFSCILPTIRCAK